MQFGPSIKWGLKRWYENGSLHYDTILQLGQYCKKMKKTVRDTIPHPSVRGLPDPN
jgi:hypothetical protein